MRSSTIFALILLAILGIIFVMSLGYPHDARLFPLIIGIPTGALTLALIIREVQAKTGPEDILQRTKVAKKDVLRNLLTAPAWIAALLLMIYLVGFLAGLPLFTFLYLKLHRQGWLLSIIVPTVMVAVIYGGFVMGLKMQLHEGLLFM